MQEEFDGMAKSQEQERPFQPFEWIRNEVRDLLEEQARYFDLDEYSFADEVLDIFTREILEAAGIERFFDDLAYNGCKGGFIRETAYNIDNKEFYTRNMDDIEHFVHRLEDELGEPIFLDNPRYTTATWLVYEEMGDFLSSGIDVALEQRLEKSLSFLSNQQIEALIGTRMPQEMIPIINDTLNLRKEQAKEKKELLKPVKTPKKRGGLKR